MEKSRAIELLKLAVPIKALTQQEYSDFIEAVNMGMDALKTQLLQKGTTKSTTSDLISRQQAIDGKIVIQRTNGVEIYSDEAVPVEYLKNLPSRQPEPSTSCSEFPNNSDTVSRQAAIDAVEKNACNTQRIMDAVNNLPSAQPEQHEGHWINGKCDLCGEHAPFWAMASTYHESNYCPNCGAKMKGAKHETD